MADVIYDIKEEAAFDSMVANLDEMTEREQRDFALLLNGYQAGVRAAQLLAEGQQIEPA